MSRCNDDFKFIKCALKKLLADAQEHCKTEVIDSLPYGINSPGHYVLRRDLTHTGSGPAIAINVDDVCIDLCCHRISVQNEATAIYIKDRQNVLIQNGELKELAIPARTNASCGIRIINGKNITTDNLTITDFRRNIWAGEAFRYTLTIASGAAAGTYFGLKATLSPSPVLLTAPLIVAPDLSGLPGPGQSFVGKIVLVQRGAPFSFQQKIDNAVANGAVGVIIYNNTTDIASFAGSPVNPNIPVLSISQADGLFIVNNLQPDTPGTLEFLNRVSLGVDDLTVDECKFSTFNDTADAIAGIELSQSNAVDIRKSYFGNIGDLTANANSIYLNGYNVGINILNNHFINTGNSNPACVFAKDGWSNILVEGCEMLNGKYSLQLRPSVNDPATTAENIIVRKCNMVHKDTRNFRLAILAGGVNGLIEDCNINGVLTNQFFNSGIGFGLLPETKNWKVLNTNISGGMVQGIGISGGGFEPSNIVVDNCNIKGCQTAGVYLELQSKNCVVKNSIISENGTGIYVSATCNNNVFENNTVNNNVLDGIFLDANTTRNVVKENIVLNNARNGVVDTSGNNLVLSNVSCGNGAQNYVGVPAALIGLPGSTPVTLGQNITCAGRVPEDEAIVSRAVDDEF